MYRVDKDLSYDQLVEELNKYKEKLDAAETALKDSSIASEDKLSFIGQAEKSIASIDYIKALMEEIVEKSNNNNNNNNN
jgi:hypothetical protein